MNLRNKAVLTALVLAALACSGTDANRNGADVTDLTAAGYTLPTSSSIQVSPTQPSVGVGQTIKLATNVYDVDGRQMRGIMGLLAHWRSSDTTIATVSVTGIVRGLRRGHVTVSAISGGRSGSSVVTVGSDAPTTSSDAPSDTSHSTTVQTSTSDKPTTTAASAPASSKPSDSPPASTPPKSTAPAAPPVTTPPPAIVTPPPAATPPPSSSGPVISSTGPGLSGMALISDDFSQYSSTAALMARITANNPGGTGPTRGSFYGDGINASLASIDNSVLYNGHPTLKLNQPGGVANTPWLGVALPSPTSHVWYRAKIRFSPGWTTTGTLTNSSNAYKMLSWGWSSAYGDGSGRIEITNTNGYELYENVQNGGSLTGGGSYLQAGTVSTEWSDGGWYDYIVEVDHSVNPGVIRLWRGKDGNAPAYSGQAIEKMNNGSSMPPISSISVGLNFNQVRAANQNQAVWWGQWEVVDGAAHPNPFGVTAY